MMSDEEKAIERFKRKYGATSCRFKENGDLILTRGRGSKTEQLKVTASTFSEVVDRLRTGGEPLMRAVLLGDKARPKRRKPDPGKRFR